MSAWHLSRFRFGGRRRRRFTAQDFAADLERALLQLYDEVGHEFSKARVDDEEFMDYASDQMADAGVSDDAADAALEWLRRGASRGRR